MTRLAFLALACAACGPVGTPSVEGIVGEALARVERAPASVGAAAGPVPTYREILRGAELTLGAELDPGARSFRLVVHERGADGRDARTRAWTLPADFAIDAVAATAAWELCVAGIDATGEDVLERWRVEAWSSGSDAAPLVHRELVARGFRLGGTRLIVCPPPNESALLLAKDGSALVEIPLAAGAAPTRRFDVGELPALRNACSAFVGEHLDAGRVITLDAPAAGSGIDRAVLVDRDRDGWIDEAWPCTSAEWAASRFQGAVWLSTQRVEAR